MAGRNHTWNDADIQAMKATLRESQSVLAAVQKLGTTPGALRKAFQHRGLGPPSSYLGTTDAAKARTEARAGWSPDHDMTHEVPAPFHLRGVSTYYGADGEVKGQWVKSQIDKDSRAAALLDAVKTIAEPFRGASEPVAQPEHVNADLLTVYPMGDPHLGAYAWAEETGENFDLEIAERNLVSAVDKLVALSPPSEQALVLNLGDFFHADNAENRTARSGNALDVDSRWSKVLSVGIRAMRRCIDRALEKHRVVHVINEIGNHDDHTAVMLSLCLAQFYEREPRVRIDTSPAAFHWFRFGECMLGVTHGHTVKPERLPGIMAHDRAKDWGETKHRYFYTGHVHHDSLKEYPGCTVETFRTLAARDAWHAGQGYRSGRDMKADVLHRKHGRILRHVVGIEMIAGAA